LWHGIVLLSTLAGFDRIVAMGHGRSIDDGAPDVLAARPGPYRDLLRKQQQAAADVPDLPVAA
jgi:ATP-binding cassette subfamily B protein